MPHGESPQLSQQDHGAAAPSLWPVILAGGAGTRLWPLSRIEFPKQLLRLGAGGTLLQETVQRVNRLSACAGLASVAPPLVVTHEEQRFVVREQLEAIGCAALAVLLEPVARSTAPALTLASLFVAAAGGSDADVLLVAPADHEIGDQGAFAEAIVAGAMRAMRGEVVTFGVPPRRGETGFGYIRHDARTDAAPSPPVFEVQEFVEKPGAARAARLAGDGRHLWNSGMFALKPSVWLHAIGITRPAMLEACRNAFAGLRGDGLFRRVDADAFAACAGESIDYAVMEHLGRASAGAADLPPASVVELHAGWSDVGSWQSVREISSPDEHGNVLRGDVVAEDVSGSLLVSEHRLLAALGINDVVVVETADAVLVCDRKRSQQVGALAARLREQGRGEASSHRRTHRPWGSFEALDRGERYQVKRLTLRPGAAISLQMHRHRAEHWVVVRGTAEVTRGDARQLLHENESIFIPVGTRHRLRNPGPDALEIIEVQTGEYLGEDDIVRFEDVYER